ncbi:MAG: Zn-binding domain-containing protein, partial [Thermofilaceae archaeon]
SFSKYVQRTGRCGRRGRKAYVLTVLGDDPISQYYANFPDEFFSKEPEPIAIEAHNEEVAKIQLTATAADLPLRVDELEIFESKIANELLKSGFLKIVKGGKYIKCASAGSRYLRKRPGLRGTGEVVKIYDVRGRLIGLRDMPAALKELFPGGVYLHGGETYLSVELSPTRAVVTRLPSHYSLVTSALYYSAPESFSPEISRKVLGSSIEYGKLSVREVVYGYVTRDFESGATLRETILEKEYAYGFATKGVLLRFPINPAWDSIGNAEAFHAIEHVLITAAQAAVGAGLTDLGGISFPTGHIFIYDAYPGGSGCSKLLFERFEDTFSKALRILRLCDCEDGCPKCIYSPYCGNNNKVLSKGKAFKILEQVNNKRLTGLVSIGSIEGSPIV